MQCELFYGFLDRKMFYHAQARVGVLTHEVIWKWMNNANIMPIINSAII